MFSEPPVSWETPLAIAAAISRAKTTASRLSAMVLVSLLETPSLPSCGAAN